MKPMLHSKMSKHETSLHFFTKKIQLERYFIFYLGIAVLINQFMCNILVNLLYKFFKISW